MLLLVLFIGAYLLGSVPFGLVITRAAGLGDIRTIGSGNIGATNVLRTGRKDLAFATLLLDSGKGAIAVGIAALLTEGREVAMALAGAGAFLGHCFPLYLRFKGGKGVATYLGTLLALSLPVGAASAGIWLTVAAISRYSSLAALVMAAIAPLLFVVRGDFAFAVAGLFMTLLVYLRHRANILRLLDGTESRIGDDKNKKK